MNRLLITGAGGFLGRRLCRLAAPRCTVIGVLRSPAPAALSVATVQADLSAPDTPRALVERLRPDAVIHAAALANVDACEKDPDASRVLNLETPVAFASACARAGIPFVAMSTDMIFNGQGAPYADNAPPSPLSTYGRHKAQAEADVLTTHPHALICRLPLLFGQDTPTDRNFFRAMLTNLRSRRSVRLFTDEFRTPINAEWAARHILQLSGKSSGVINLGGPERVSRLEFGLRAARLAGLEAATPEFVIPGRQADVTFLAPRPADVALDSGRARTLGLLQPTLDEQIREALDFAN